MVDLLRGRRMATFLQEALEEKIQRETAKARAA